MPFELSEQSVGKPAGSIWLEGPVSVTCGDYLVSRIVPRPDRWHPVETYPKSITYSELPTSDFGGERESLRRAFGPACSFIIAKREQHASSLSQPFLRFSQITSYPSKADKIATMAAFILLSSFPHGARRGRGLPLPA